MNIGAYQGAASLAALERWQGIISQNIASASVPGFKKTEASFESVLADVTRIGGDERSGTETNGVMPTTTARIDMKPGELRATGSETDFAIQGRGFFQVQRANGELGYTRDGEFHLSPERTLVNKQGFTVLGDGGEITFKPDGGRVSINADGTIVQGETSIGKIAVYDFADPSALRRIGDGLLAPEDGAQPAPVERPAVLTGTLEGSNVSPLQEMVNLITVARSYEASQRSIQSHDDIEGKAIESLGNPNP
jgi:flagellar basal-body rod protein FlgF